MCAACNTGELHAAPSDTGPAISAADAAPATKFAALRNRDCRTYLGGGLLSMMADNVEHVITYWVLWETFHSEALIGFQVLSHWVPFLLFSVYFGGLADRFDCRRVIQVAQVMFMSVSVAWGVLFLTDTLAVWNACLLLVVHGLAGALWGPGEQLMLHDFVGRQDLPSAVRMNATAKSLGVLLGPVIGSALLLGLGPTAGIFTNVLIYLPLTIFLARTRFTGHTRDENLPRVRLSALAAVRVLREVADEPILISLIALGGLSSFFIGASLQSVMPIFAADFGTGTGGTAYGVLLFANGVGGVIGGLLLEVTGRIAPTLRAAVMATLVLGIATLGFAATDSYLLAVVLPGDRRDRQPGRHVHRADRRADDGATGQARPGDRALRHVRQRFAVRQRHHRRLPRRPDRRALVPGPEFGPALRRSRSDRVLHPGRSTPARLDRSIEGNRLSRRLSYPAEGDPAEAALAIASSYRSCRRERTSSGVYASRRRCDRATTTPVAATPARPARPTTFHHFIALGYAGGDTPVSGRRGRSDPYRRYLAVPWPKRRRPRDPDTDQQSGQSRRYGRRPR